MVPDENVIRIEFDEVLGEYYIVWQPIVVIASGGTEKEALEDLREAAHFGIDTMIDTKLAELD